MRKQFIMLATLGFCAWAQAPFLYQQGRPVDCIQTDDKSGEPAICTVPNVRPLGDLALPPPGSSYVDHNFGATVQVATEPGTTHGYSTPTALSHTARYVATSGNGKDASNGFIYIWEVASGRLVKGPFRLGLAGFYWAVHKGEKCIDADDTYFAVYGAEVRQHCVSNSSSRLVLDGSSAVREITPTGTGDLSSDEWLAFYSKPDGKVCAAPLDASNRLHCVQYADAGTWIDFILLSKGVDSVTGKRYLLIENQGDVFSIDEPGLTLKHQYRMPEHPDSKLIHRGNGDGVCDPGEWCISGNMDHADTGELPDGTQFVFYRRGFERPYRTQVCTWKMRESSVAAAESCLYQGAQTLHYGCARSASVCVASTMPEERKAGDLTPRTATKPFQGEVIVTDFSGSQPVNKRVAKTLGVRWSQGYWALARACISDDGTAVAYSTNAGYSSSPSIRVLVARVPQSTETVTPVPRPVDPGAPRRR